MVRFSSILLIFLIRKITFRFQSGGASLTRRGDGLAAVSRRLQLGQRDRSQRVELFASDVGGDRWFAQAPGVHDNHVDTQFDKPIAQKGRLGSLGVESGQQQDGHGGDQPMMSAIGLPPLM